MVEQGLDKAQIPGAIRCPYCFERALLTDRDKSPTLDPMVRQYICPNGHAFNRRIETKEELARPAWI